MINIKVQRSGFNKPDMGKQRTGYKGLVTKECG
jgi:hypothetical protein